MKNLIRSLLNIFKRFNLSDFKSLYKGISSGLFGNIVTNAIYFLAYKYWQKIFLRIFSNLQPGDIYFSLISSLFAAITCSIVTNPIWVLHTRMANSKDSKVIRIK